jgi:DNA-binding NarL/FixJ family response regulator
VKATSHHALSVPSRPTLSRRHGYLRPTPPPTPRELEVIELVLDGHNNESINHQLGISTETVKSHLVNIFCKLTVTSRTELAVTVLRRRHAVELAQARTCDANIDLQSH